MGVDFSTSAVAVNFFVSDHATGHDHHDAEQSMNVRLDELQYADMALAAFGQVVARGVAPFFPARSCSRDRA